MQQGTSRVNSLCLCLYCVLAACAGGSIEDVPRGTTAGQILRDKGVFAIMDATAGAASSDSDAESSGPDTPAADATSSRAASISSGSSGGSKGRSRLKQRQQQAGASPEGQLVNVNNRLVSEDTVLQDGDLVILAREKIKI